MKKLLFFVLAVAFTTVASAQKLSVSSVTKTDAKEMMKENPKMEKQITDALMKDKDLQKETLEYLKSNPETKSMFGKLYKENKGVAEDVMKSVLSNPKLSSKVTDWISGNPEMLNKVLSLTNM
ncbi:MAG: hypothetical protein QM499_00615 [Flavobacteriaceae bacterium]